MQSGDKKDFDKLVEPIVLKSGAIRLEDTEKRKSCFLPSAIIKEEDQTVGESKIIYQPSVPKHKRKEDQNKNCLDATDSSASDYSLLSKLQSSLFFEPGKKFEKIEMHQQSQDQAV